VFCYSSLLSEPLVRSVAWFVVIHGLRAHMIWCPVSSLFDVTCLYDIIPRRILLPISIYLD